MAKATGNQARVFFEKMMLDKEKRTKTGRCKSAYRAVCTSNVLDLTAEGPCFCKIHLNSDKLKETQTTFISKTQDIDRRFEELHKLLFAV